MAQAEVAAKQDLLAPPWSESMSQVRLRSPRRDFCSRVERRCCRLVAAHFITKIIPATLTPQVGKTLI